MPVLSRARECRFDNGTVFRITTGAGTDQHPVRVIQLGTYRELDEQRHRIVHESTRDTGLRHRRWTVSAARYEAGVVYGSFFVCMRDEPALDFAGARHADGLSYAAFGDVSDGFETLEAIYAMAQPCELLASPIGIDSVDILDHHVSV